MKLRQFLASLPVALFAGKALAISKPKQLTPPQQEWPWYDDKAPVGLWMQAWNYDKKLWDVPFLVLREFDELTDNPYQGMELNNMRRNKYWGKSLNSGKTVLLCFDRWETGIRFFKDAPNIDWSTVYPI